MTATSIPQLPARAPAGALGVTGFVLALVVPPAGLIVSLVALASAHRRALRGSSLTIAAIPIAAVLLFLQLAGVGIAIAVGTAIQATANREECTAITRYSDLLAASGPSSLATATQATWDAEQDRIGTWHSQVLDLAFSLPDQAPDASDPLSTAVRNLSSLLDPATGFSGKDLSSVPQQVAAIREWRTTHCS